MKLAVSPIPPWTQTLTAYLVVKNAGDAITSREESRPE
jgi:hypothetical protein